MSSPYTKDLGLEVTFKLPSISVYSLSILNNQWSKLIANDFWVTKFIRDFGASLPFGADYEVEYIVMEMLGLDKFYRYVIRRKYNKLLVSMLSKWGSIETLIVEASEYGNLEIVKLLLTNGADIHAREDEALIYAVASGHLEVVKLLLANGANIHAQEDQALKWAAAYGKLEMVKLLLANGASIHIQDDFALRFAAANGHLEVVKLLLANGVNIKAISNEVYRNKAIMSLIKDYNKSS